ncbi:cytidine deaminase-like protein [Cylindrobasidium torrendii FP15055 ss-10]|uniref:Cytidine deaminase-like protein n=1 Tax=Cylindrobasidium torrendii FP15055 ss-10 TaxID=1314674 RepID=A0A0D7BP11_9AGAR|nr:cytidine deaminase-like protein [Cylindrobasidium torrendii FP15055 ss-10]
MSLPAKEMEALILSTFEAKSMAYSRYSGFPVGAAVQTSDGRIFKGASVDNLSPGAGVCAERVALLKAVTEGCRSISGMAITSTLREPITPCGLCRQVISEFCDEGMPVYMAACDWVPGATVGVLQLSVGELL